MTGADGLGTARRALGRAAQLLAILDREHTTDGLHAAARAVRHELRTAQEALGGEEEAAPGSPSGAASPGPVVRQEDVERAARTRPGSGRHLVLLELRERGCPLTDAELVAALADRMMPSSVHARRWELCAAGWVMPRLSSSPHEMYQRRHGQTLWELTKEGAGALAKLDSGQLVLALLEGDMPEVV